MVTFGIERAININKDVPLGEPTLVHLKACRNKPRRHSAYMVVSCL